MAIFYKDVFLGFLMGELSKDEEIYYYAKYFEKLIRNT